MGNNSRNPSPAIRWQLLSTVSAFALLASAYATGEAQAADTDRPLLWIELGGQMENVSGQGEVFAPPFMAANAGSSVLGPVTPLQAQQPPKFSYGEEGKISFRPEGSDWIFSAGLRFGRSNDFKHVHHQTYRTFRLKYKSGVPNYNSNPRGIDKFSDTQAHHRERHMILDFSAGKDVGLGMFGKDSSSVVSLGVRFAQFTSKSTFDIRARPDLQFKYLNLPTYHISLQFPYYQTYHATGRAERGFHGLGPSLSWNGSVRFLGNPQDGEITFDWGANAALLFGRQKARVQHQESEHYVTSFFWGNGARFTGYLPVPHGHSIDRSVTVPNVGGSLGVSWRVENFKVSLGYRADFFLGAMDAGIDMRKSETLGFKGPFASISVGLGD
jgi:iron complex outermembrane recepter protein